jgi:uncharacterized protein with von Willebrand factor type A (vWA) domain
MQAKTHISRYTDLTANIIAFCRHLRENGSTVSAADQVDVLRALEVLPFKSPEEFRLALRAVLTKSPDDQVVFDELFWEYWENLFRAFDSKIKQAARDASQNKATLPESQKKQSSSFKSLRDWLHGKTAKEETDMAGYSAAEVFSRKDFSTFSEDQLQEVMKLINLVAKSLATRYSRRYRRSQHSRNFDLRRTMRLNMRRGGEILDLAYRNRRIKRLKMVMFCDVSKSMDLYSRFLIQFIYAFQNVYRRIETFVFSTSLHRITDDLKTAHFKDALDRLSATVPGWSGGTRIGASFKAFLDEYGRKLLDGRTIVLIMSDGWDTGDIEVLAESMGEIHRKAARVIWLNPLAGSAEYQPTVRGMQAALPSIDVFAPAHNVESLRRLSGSLDVLKRKRAKTRRLSRH